MKTRFFLLASAAILLGASAARAQNAPTTDTSTVAPAPDSVATPHNAVRSVIDAPPVAAHRSLATQSLAAAMAQTHQGMGQAKALMIVGGAGFIAGALISGDSGRIIMVGSAIIGLYGLYEYMQ